MSDEEVTLQDKLAEIDYELQTVETQILSLQERKEFLLRQKQSLKDEMTLKKSLTLANRNWSSKDFPWYKKVVEVLETTFKLPGFRPHQLQTVNAVLSKEDTILIMPTGGGKSLCYQLPALVLPGITLVISPLVSLMEDQLFALKALNVNAAMMSASATREEVNSIQQAMVDKNSKLKMIYVTPEKLAKSKRFMTKLQKMYELKRLSLMAIDEVHCCSQWGHDFRPDYKFLGVLKGMFPDVPILGLTATATSKVIVDVQKMLNISGCLVFRASFNRPNLFYEVREKPSNQKECFDSLVELMKTKYAGKSGIIYATSIKDCEELMQELRKRGIRAGCYHATLDAALRSKVHQKWLSGEYQAVVATIAFGMGIDKPDVRFVIHHSLSKSMENFYQESGRAGRDNKPADCILYYRFADVFRLSTMVFTQQTGLECLYGIVAYCLDKTRCRRSIIASHFNEGWDTSDCNEMCDHCRRPREKKEIEIVEYCRSLYKLIQNAAGNDAKLTAQMLVDAWFGKGKANLRVSSVKVPSLSREMAEDVVGHLLIEGYLAEDFHFTPYNTISYIKRGPRAAAALSEKATVKMCVQGARKTEINKGSPKANNTINSEKKAKVENNARTKSETTKAENTMKSEKKVKVEKHALTESMNNVAHKRPSTLSSDVLNSITPNSSKEKRGTDRVINLCDDEDLDFVPLKKKKVFVVSSDDEG
ncbi:hypothetical protein R5R35_010218 [Gryllus longicercus]|uniref:ATP-dependent DNA helicase n=1 Tax=Gryllus longicercus TaxID=2509291 RepID=A0AAN9ZEW2_9ORTH